LSGPTVPLIAERGGESDELLGGNARQPATDAMVTKVLVRGEAVRAPAGRADDFAWPRRSVAPVGADPVVATTDLPMTPMLTERGSGATTTAAAAPSTEAASVAPHSAPRRVARRAPRPPSYYYADAQAMYRPPRPPSYADAQSMYRPDYRRPPVQ